MCTYVYIRKTREKKNKYYKLKVAFCIIKFISFSKGMHTKAPPYRFVFHCIHLTHIFIHIYIVKDRVYVVSHSPALVSHSHAHHAAARLVHFSIVGKVLQILLNGVNGLIDIVLATLIRQHHWRCRKIGRYLTGNMRAHKSLHKFTNQFPAIGRYQTRTIFNLNEMRAGNENNKSTPPKKRNSYFNHNSLEILTHRNTAQFDDEIA